MYSRSDFFKLKLDECISEQIKELKYIDTINIHLRTIEILNKTIDELNKIIENTKNEYTEEQLLEMARILKDKCKNESSCYNCVFKENIDKYRHVCKIACADSNCIPAEKWDV